MAQKINNRLALMKVSAAAKEVAKGYKPQKVSKLLIAVVCPIEYLSGDEWVRLTSRLQDYSAAKNVGSIRIAFGGGGVSFYASRYMGDSELGRSRVLPYKDIETMTPAEIGRLIDFELEEL